MSRKFLGSCLLLLAALGLYGCPSDDSCVTDADCFAGEVCAQERCTPDDGSDVGHSGDDGGSDQGGPNNGGDDGGGDEDGGNNGGGDAGDGGDGESDASSDAADDMMLGACEVDPFTYQCTDDGYEEDDEWIDGTKLFGETLGCNPDFQPMDETFIAKMCPLDGSDWFYVDFRSCDGMDYILEFQLEVEQPCARSDIHFEPLSFECSEDFVQCMDVDGKPTVRMIVSDTIRNLQSSYVRVHIDDRNDLAFDYRLNVSVRE